MLRYSQAYNARGAYLDVYPLRESLAIGSDTHRGRPEVVMPNLPDVSAALVRRNPKDPTQAELTANTRIQ